MNAIEPAASARAAHTVGLVNGLLVIVLPFGVLALASALEPDSNTSVTVHASGFELTNLLMGVIPVVAMLLPFAVLAGWRSQVHARRWCEEHDRGWRAVWESGACGLAIALVVLLPGIVMRPLDAAPYLIVYGGGALVAGLLVGLLLRMTAILVLKLHKSAAV